MVKYPRYKLMQRYRKMPRAEYSRKEEVTITDDRIQLALLTDKPLGRFKIGTETIPVILIPTYWNKDTERYELGRNPVEDIREWGGMDQTPMDLLTELQNIMTKQDTGNDLLNDLHNALYSIGSDQIQVRLASSGIYLGVNQNNGYNVVYSNLVGADETIAQEVLLDTIASKLLEIYAKATASTTFHLDVSPDNSYWITDYVVWSGVTEVKETMWCGFRYVKLRSDAGGVAGDTVDLVISAKP